MRISRLEFTRLVRESIAMIPGEFRPYLEGVEIVVEDEPGTALLKDLGIEEDETLLGLYSGMPLIDRWGQPSEGLRDSITIFRLPFLEEFKDREEIRREVAITVIHELAHHFGIDEDRLTELGWG